MLGLHDYRAEGLDILKIADKRKRQALLAQRAQAQKRRAHHFLAAMCPQSQATQFEAANEQKLMPPQRKRRRKTFELCLGMDKFIALGLILAGLAVAQRKPQN